VNARVGGLLAAVATLLAAACGGGGGGGVTNPGGGGGARNLSGTVTYDFVPAVFVPGSGGGLDFAHAVQKPVRAAVVKVLKGTTVLATGATDSAGHYSIAFTESGTGQLAVAAFSQTTTNPAITVLDNTDGATWAVGANLDGTQTTQDLRATHGWTGSAYDPAKRGAAPFAILDSMYTAASAFIAARPAATFPALVVNWSPNNVPQQGNKAQGQIGTSHFSPSESNGVGQIYVLGKEGADTDEFDTHVIVHEWAHYFEHNLSRSDSPGGQHGGGDVLDPRLSFGEGYGNALAAMLLPESIYADTLWSGSNLVAGGFDAETDPATLGLGLPTDDPAPSVFSETSVCRFLYDLFDGGAGEAYDGVNVGLGVIYDVLTGPEKNTQALTTIASFIAGLKAQPGVNATAIDTLAAHYKIGAITTEYGAGDTEFAWMFYPVASLTANSCGAGCRAGQVTLTGNLMSNKAYANQYLYFTGTGGSVTVTATSTEDVGLEVLQAGVRQGAADALNTGGTETLTFTTTAGKVYFVRLVGFSPTAADYTVDMTIQGI